MGSLEHFDAWNLAAGALRITWRHKSLWIYGFLASLSGRTALSFVDEWGPASRSYLESRPAVLALVVFLVVLAWLLFFSLGLISRGALIGGAGAGSRGLAVTAGGAWRAGLRAFPRLLGLVALAVVAFVTVSAVLAIPLVLPLAAGAAGLAIAVVIGAILFFPYLAFLFGLTFTVTYAERAVVIEDAGVLEAVAAGWNTVRANVGRSFVVWLVMLVSTLAYLFSLVAVLAALAVPFLLLGLMSLPASVVLGVPVGLAVVAVATGAFGCYSYALWTLAYTELRALPGLRGGGP